MSTETLKHLGKQVSPNEMKPVDLVFFDTYKLDGHVGIYIGNGKFIGSQSSTGVSIEDMTKGYWKERFNGRSPINVLKCFFVNQCPFNSEGCQVS
jgi:peptidoglycan DL-endopeptidase CwlO